MVLEGNTMRNWFCAPAYANRTCSQSRKLRCTQYKADGLQILREQRSPESEGSRSSRRDRAKEAYIMRATNIRKKQVAARFTRPTFYHNAKTCSREGRVGGNREMMFFIFVLLLFARR